MATSSQTSFTPLLTAFFIIITFISSTPTHAYTFQVGGKNGWTSHPSENYTTWSARLRFLINDTLHFKYDGGSDSVLVVNKSDYDGCNANNPIKKLDGGGDSLFKFDRSGPFYFITGNKSNCDQGQKLTVVVLALRKNRSPPPSVATPPSSSTLPPTPAVSPSIFSPPVGSPELSPSDDETPSADSPGGESADSAGGRRADSPGGGGGQSPNNAGEPSANGSASPRSAAVPPLSATIIVSVVTMIYVLWGIN
ncbi:hypothetical protein SSX86_005819 [Deinandra increscens subsp. villosa]|uniref:Phytocyanin domain-containing protein n=1 Tax=Deinandra increscens subsp. villosa TaxID=3103831 RepID=A0AAP0DR83_9ASTR